MLLNLGQDRLVAMGGVLCGIFILCNLFLAPVTSEQAGRNNLVLFNGTLDSVSGSYPLYLKSGNMTFVCPCRKVFFSGEKVIITGIRQDYGGREIVKVFSIRAEE